ncbi:MAG: pseudouridine synthase [Spirochaetia bacterium]|nr:pseudouridine synthase [Spirochaetales bacterium]MDX9783465.1 pseudouridine synthase [Spirochaetia bacterium]
MCADLLGSDASRPFSPCDAPFLAFETDSYRIFFKPAGMHSVSVASGDSGENLLEWVRTGYPDQKSAYAALSPVGSASPDSSVANPDTVLFRARRELGMLSRLDRETSGLVAFARKPKIFFQVLEEQARGRTRKRYWLFATQTLHEEGLEGSMPPCLFRDRGDPFYEGREFSVESYFRSYGPKAQRVACLAPQPGLKMVQRRRQVKKLSQVLYQSDFRPLAKTIEGNEKWPSVPGCLAWEASIRAGFRHQIRAHMAWCGHPIAGDRLYGLPKMTGVAGPENEARLYLECHRLELPSPGGGTEIFELADGEIAER